MTEAPNQPGPGRATSERAFDQLTKEIAQRNERAQRAARKVRDAREQEKLAIRRRDDQRT
jgi:hypothetical protein